MKPNWNEVDQPKGWPKVGDRLFRDDLPDFQHNACMWRAPDDISGWSLYTRGYRDVADAAVSQILEHRRSIDFWVFPILFLYRHHFELQLKTIIKIGARVFEESDAVSPTHRICDLWPRARSYMMRHWPQDKFPVYAAIGHCMEELQALDDGGFAFRYPVDLKDNQTLRGIRYINIRNFAEVAVRISDCLSACITAMWHDLDQKHEVMARLWSELGEDESS